MLHAGWFALSLSVCLSVCLFVCVCVCVCVCLCLCVVDNLCIQSSFICSGWWDACAADIFAHLIRPISSQTFFKWVWPLACPRLCVCVTRARSLVLLSLIHGPFFPLPSPSFPSLPPPPPSFRPSPPLHLPLPLLRVWGSAVSIGRRSPSSCEERTGGILTACSAQMPSTPSSGRSACVSKGKGVVQGNGGMGA